MSKIYFEQIGSSLWFRIINWQVKSIILKIKINGVSHKKIPEASQINFWKLGPQVRVRLNFFRIQWGLLILYSFILLGFSHSRYIRCLKNWKKMYFIPTLTAKISDFPCILMLPFSENQKQKRRDLVQNKPSGCLILYKFRFPKLKNSKPPL